MSRHLQNILYLIILIIVSFVLYALSPKYDKTLHGVYLPAQSQATHPTISPKQVTLLRTLPKGAIVLGTIRTMQHFASTKTTILNGLQRNAVEHAAKIAAAHGANALYINELGYTPGVGPLDGVVLYGQAIYLPKTHKS